jgi:hypothetical protein
MKKLVVFLSGTMLMLALFAGSAIAYTIGYDYAVDAHNGLTTKVTGAYVETFDTSSSLWSWNGNYKIRNNSTSGISAAPYNPLGSLHNADSTYFISVPDVLITPATSLNDSVTATERSAIFGKVFDYFGLWWGSVDTYNSIEFYNNGTKVDSITGTIAIAPSTANGNQTAPSTNLYVNIYNLHDFNSFKIISTNYAFEADNIAVAHTAPVPEPGTMALLGIGMAGLAIFGKRRMNKEA